MGLEAREVLNACWDSINALDSGEYLHWESHWRAAVTGLRAVGHTLKPTNEDDETYRAVIRAHFQRLEKERDSEHIFWVIKKMRDLLLKNNDGLPECQRMVEGDDIRLTFTLPDGTDGLELLREAANWWDEELSAIEEELGEE